MLKRVFLYCLSPFLSVQSSTEQVLDLLILQRPWRQYGARRRQNCRCCYLRMIIVCVIRCWSRKDADSDLKGKKKGWFAPHFQGSLRFSLHIQARPPAWRAARFNENETLIIMNFHTNSNDSGVEVDGWDLFKSTKTLTLLYIFSYTLNARLSRRQGFTATSRPSTYCNTTSAFYPYDMNSMQIHA